VLRYVDGQKYEPHYDYFHDTINTRIENGGQRVVTMLMYLSTPGEGGETVFPDAERKVCVWVCYGGREEGGGRAGQHTECGVVVMLLCLLRSGRYSPP
jgi:hypothetical protein